MLIALGSNVASSAGPPDETLRAAVGRLRESGLPAVGASRIHATPAFPAGIGPDFVNAVMAVDPMGRSAPEVLAILHGVEAEFGRRRLDRWGPRTLDLDLIADGDAVLPDHAVWAAWRGLPADAQRQRVPESLVLPHPRLEERLFVLIPLAEAAPGWRHPVTGATVEALIAARPEAERLAIRPIGPLDASL